MPKNLKSASEAALIKSNLNKSGVDKGSIEVGGIDIIEQLAGEFVVKVLENINAANLIDTGEITNIQTEVKDGSLTITAPDHLIYQSKGVSGTEVKYNTPFSYTNKMPPVEMIKEWLRRKGVPQEELDKRAWAVSKSIYKEGITPKNLYEKELDELVIKIEEAIGEYVAQFVGETIPEERIIGK